MISEHYISEIKNRDFFLNVNHFNDFDDIKTSLVLGNQEDVQLTVIIPVYDHPIEFITRAIRSALDQVEVNISYQVLVIDDYCDKNRSNGVEDYLRKISDSRVIYYKNEKNLGVFGNWNRGIQLSRSEWVTLLHSDDFYKPNFIKNMFSVIESHPEIDQLTCKYQMIDYTQNKVNDKDFMTPAYGNAILRKIDYREYIYDMVTSVKGAIYKRKTLIDIGGFRSQGFALGLDDYSLMMRYAFYYNTYYLDAVLYVDSWGFNDSLNIKHWYPQLIADYFMWKAIEKKRSPFISWGYKKKDFYVLLKRAKEFANGTSYIKKIIPVDFEELYRICCVKKSLKNFIYSFIGRLIAKIDLFYIKFKISKEKIHLV